MEEFPARPGLNKLARDQKVSSLINCQAMKEFTSPGITRRVSPQRRDPGWRRPTDGGRGPDR